MRGRTEKSTQDRGSALVAAVGVAVIAMMLVVVVVSQAVVVTNDSQRDRVRTTEVHSAEAALDTTLASLRTGPVCEATYTYGSGSTETTVTVEIEYYNESGLLTCTGNVLSDTATKAIATATSTATNDSVGINPERVMEATVNLQAIATSIPGAALFSGGNINPGGGYTVGAAAETEAAAVWQDSGDWLCNPNKSAIDGSVFVPNGSATFSSSGCYVTGNLYAATYIQIQTKASNGGYHVGGNAVAYGGNLILNNPITVLGNLSIAGTVPLGTVQWNATDVGGTVCSSNTTACPGLEYYTPIGLPEIPFIASDWVADGYTVSDMTGYGDVVEASWVPTFKQAWKESSLATSLASCTVPVWIAEKDEVDVDFPSTPTVYDMRSCGGAFTISGNGSGGVSYTMNLYADTAIIVPSLEVTNGFTITSGDGDVHDFAIIVPDADGAVNGTATCSQPGNISLSSAALQVDSNVTLFMYTPCEAGFQNQTTVYGQVYAGSVKVGANGTEFNYRAVDVPGVELAINQSSASSGYYVQIANKREMR